MSCKQCEEYFSKYSCGMAIYGECDCPRCQGYCALDRCEAMMHESGLTMERWNWPFKTAEERKAVAKYFKEYESREKERMLKDLGQPDW